MNYRRIGQAVLKFGSLPSTNDYASFLLTEGKAEDGMLIVAEEQVAGRGQRGRTWYSVPGESLTFSLILKDMALPVERGFMLQIVSGLAIKRYVSAWLPQADVLLKWPNDVMAERRKLAGILTEAQIQGGLISSVVIGIGMNLNQNHFPEAAGEPVSMFLLGAGHSEPDLALGNIIQYLRDCFRDWESRGDAPLIEEYSAHFFGKGERRKFHYQNQEIEAIPLGISDEGALVLENMRGEKMFVDSAALRWL
jgi:BirA family biotin operon repressor/biotin-[acetyl-CoA-carboxylase] ligase